jgi:hypothetical protein
MARTLMRSFDTHTEFDVCSRAKQAMRDGRHGPDERVVVRVWVSEGEVLRPIQGRLTAVAGTHAWIKLGRGRVIPARNVKRIEYREERS